MEPWRTILLVLTIVGAVVTIYGLGAAYRSARDEHAAAGARLERLQALASLETAEQEALTSGGDQRADEVAAINARYEVLFSAEGFTRPNWGNLPYLAQHESQYLLGRVLQETRRDLVIAGIGLAVSTGASVWSLYL